jgi:hypothetical protein
MTLPPLDDRSHVSPRRPDGSRGIAGPHVGPIRLTPTRVTLGVALVGSVLFGVYAITVRDAAQIPLLASGFLVLGLVFGALAVAGAIGTYRSARDDLSGRALLQALGGGIAAIIACACLAVFAVLVLLWRQPA